MRSFGIRNFPSASLRTRRPSSDVRACTFHPFFYIFVHKNRGQSWSLNKPACWFVSLLENIRIPFCFEEQMIL